MVINFNAHRANQSTRKLAQIPTLKKKILENLRLNAFVFEMILFFLIKIFRYYLYNTNR
jgi:hypothetical protein